MSPTCSWPGVVDGLVEVGELVPFFRTLPSSVGKFTPEGPASSLDLEMKFRTLAKSRRRRRGGDSQLYTYRQLEDRGLQQDNVLCQCRHQL